MNSQQELLDAINTITQSKDKSCDTPATVLRVDGDTAWVHIDGGADETPVRKTVNCEEGEVVQVRISNGSAFLVGNASAPPTDDKVANAAQFVAVQADEKATKAIETAEAIVQTVSGKVDSGTSNITDISSTMYQNAYGVDIFNNTLAVGDSYAHIDGDSFDIKVCTTAGTIDDANDGMYARFGREVTVGTRDVGSEGLYSQVFGSNCIAVGDYSHAEGRDTKAFGNYSHAEGRGSVATDNYSHAEGYETEAKDEYAHAEGVNTEASGYASHAECGYSTATGAYSHAEGIESVASGAASHAQNYKTEAASDYQTTIGTKNIVDNNNTYAFIIGNGDDVTPSNAMCVDWSGNVLIDGDVTDLSGNRKTAKVLTSTTISSATTSYTFSDASIKADSVIDIYDTIFGFAPTAMTVSAGSCAITFPAQASTHTIKLFVY